MSRKLAKNWRFWGIDINVFMGDLPTLSLILVLVAALFRHLKGPKEKDYIPKRPLRILAIDYHKISQKLAFWGIDINVFMGHLSTLSKVKNTHLALQKCIICQVATIGSILKFESKWLMSGQTSCIASILKDPPSRTLQIWGRNFNIKFKMSWCHRIYDVLYILHVKRHRQ